MLEHHVKANRDLLPPRWQQDEMMRDEVHRKIWALRWEGCTLVEIARRVGCSDRSVSRILKL